MTQIVRRTFLIVLFNYNKKSHVQNLPNLKIEGSKQHPIMLKSAEGWDQVATFVALTMRRKMEIAREQQGGP